MAMNQPPTRQRGKAYSSSTARGATARATTTSCSSRHPGSFPSSSARPCRTLAPTPSFSTTEARKATFLPAASTRRTLKSGRANATTIPGKPPPLPRSQTAPPRGHWPARRQVRESHTCLTAASRAPVMAVKLRRWLACTTSTTNRAMRSLTSGARREARGEKTGSASAWSSQRLNSAAYDGGSNPLPHPGEDAWCSRPLATGRNRLCLGPAAPGVEVDQQDRDVRGRHPGDAGRLADGPGADHGQLLARLPGEAGDRKVVEPVRDGFRLQAAEAFHLFLLLGDVPFVLHFDLHLAADGFIHVRQARVYLHQLRPRDLGPLQELGQRQRLPWPQRLRAQAPQHLLDRFRAADARCAQPLPHGLHGRPAFLEDAVALVGDQADL